VEELLKPLLEYVPPLGQCDKTPTKEQVMGTNPLKTTTMQRKVSVSAYQPEKRMKMDPEQEKIQNEQTYHTQADPTLSEQFFDFHDAKNYYNPYISGGYYGMDPYMQYHQPPPPAQNHIAPAAESSSERHRAAIMSLFLNNSPTPGQESMFLHSVLPPDFDIDLVLDDQGHTALHWAAALANINLLTLLIQKGAQIDRLNYSGESALMRSIMVSHNYERQSFLELLTVLKETILFKDKKNRTILHQICLTSSAKGKSQSSIYYMHSILEFITKSAYDDAMSSQLVHSDNQLSIARSFASFINILDLCGDTAINIASRLGNKVLFNMLVEGGADVNIPNYAGLRPFDFGFEITTRKSNVAFINSEN
jgi:regulatory protein SWI6